MLRNGKVLTEPPRMCYKTTKLPVQICGSSAQRDQKDQQNKVDVTTFISSGVNDELFCNDGEPSLCVCVCCFFMVLTTLLPLGGGEKYPYPIFKGDRFQPFSDLWAFQCHQKIRPVFSGVMKSIIVP